MNIWQDKFKNFKEAKKFQKGKGFSGKKWKSSQFKLLIDCKKKILLKKKIPEKHTKRYKDLLFILNKLFKKKNNLDILDFGGGIGIGYFYLTQNIKKKINYTIVEIPSFIKNIKNHKEPKIKYNSKIILKKYDLINCCSVFQYIGDWKKEIKKLTETKTKYIYFADMFVGNITSYVSLQNYYKNKIPHWFLNYREFDEELRKNDYKLMYKSKMNTKRLGFKIHLPMENFNLKDRIPHTLNLLYKKI